MWLFSLKVCTNGHTFPEKSAHTPCNRVTVRTLKRLLCRYRHSCTLYTPRWVSASKLVASIVEHSVHTQYTLARAYKRTTQRYAIVFLTVPRATIHTISYNRTVQPLAWQCILQGHNRGAAGRPHSCQLTWESSGAEYCSEYPERTPLCSTISRAMSTAGILPELLRRGLSELMKMKLRGILVSSAFESCPLAEPEPAALVALVEAKRRARNTRHNDTRSMLSLTTRPYVPGY